MEMHFISCIALLQFTICSAFLESIPNSKSVSVHSFSDVNDYAVGDLNRCLEIAKKNKVKIKGLEALPGFGWDNLRNVDQAQIISFNYSKCRVTDDGRFLLPDHISASPIKTSQLQIFAELINHWKDWKSTTASSINADIAVNNTIADLNGRFSSDFAELKTKHIEDMSMTTRSQIRYIRYATRLQPDSPLQQGFRSSVLEIAEAVEQNKSSEVQYLSQILVRDFGTHVITSVDAGAALLKEDHIQEKWIKDQADQKSKILASASLSLYKSFNITIAAAFEADDSFAEQYHKSITSSKIFAIGGPIYLPENFTLNTWAQAIDWDLVPLDRSGDPLHFLITSAAFPELSTSTLAGVAAAVQEAIKAYYTYNVIKGCLQQQSSNFAPAANVEDGTCNHTVRSNTTFGGMYMKCRYDNDNEYPHPENICNGLNKANILTGNEDCPKNYNSAKLYTYSKSEMKTISVRDPNCWLYDCWKDKNIYCIAYIEIFWCYVNITSAENSGYLFGGLYTPHSPNPVTQSHSCPPNFHEIDGYFPSKLSVCVSSDTEYGSQYSLTFGGFMSCSTGNPLTSEEYKKNLNLKSVTRTSTFLSTLEASDPSDWPHRCPHGYSQHLATIEENCEIDYCIPTASLLTILLPPIKRPPFLSPLQNLHTPNMTPRPSFNKFAVKSKALEDIHSGFSFSKMIVYVLFTTAIVLGIHSCFKSDNRAS